VILEAYGRDAEMQHAYSAVNNQPRNGPSSCVLNMNSVSAGLLEKIHIGSRDALPID
jgi:hypothetical protein